MEPTMHFRWLISHRNDYERVLQQLWCDPASTDSDEWRNVPEVMETKFDRVLAGLQGTPPATA